MKTYKYEEIFTDNEDSSFVNMTIPVEICKELGWVPGDIIQIIVDEGNITLKKHE